MSTAIHRCHLRHHPSYRNLQPLDWKHIRARCQGLHVDLWVKCITALLGDLSLQPLLMKPLSPFGIVGPVVNNVAVCHNPLMKPSEM